MAVRSGTLEPLKLFKVFRSMLDRRMSGLLTLKRGRVEKKAHIFEGQPVRVGSNAPEESLLHVLVEEGLISTTERIDVESEMRRTHQPLERLLVNRRLIAEARLDGLERRLQRGRLVSSFAWPDGSFSFEPRELQLAHGERPLDVVALLVEAVAKAVPEAWCAHFASRFEGQEIQGTNWANSHGAGFDRFFPKPNLRSLCASPKLPASVASELGGPAMAQRQVTAFVLSGLGTFRRPGGPAPAEAPPPPKAQPRSMGVRAVRTPAPPPRPAPTSRPPPDRASAAPRTPPRGRARASTPPQGSPARPPERAGPTPTPRRGSPASAEGARPRTGPLGASPSGAHRASPTGPRRASPTGPRRASPSGSRRASPTGPRRASPSGAIPASETGPRRRAGARVANASATGPRRAYKEGDDGAGGLVGETDTAARRSATNRKAMPLKVRERLKRALDLAGEMEIKTNFELLGVTKESTEREVTAAFKALAREFHIDRFARFDLQSGTRETLQKLFMQLNRAEEILTDPEQRAEYIARLEMPASAAAAAAGGTHTESVVAQALRAERLVKDGSAALAAGKADAAKERFDEALELTPEDPVAQAGQAFVEYLLTQGKGGSTVAANRTRTKLEEITQEYSGRDEPFVWLGRVLRGLGDTQKAMVAFQRALEINPHCAEAGSELRHLKRKAEGTKKRGGLFGRKKR